MRTKIQKISRYAPSIFQGRLAFSLPAGRQARGRGFSLTVEHPAESALFRMFIGTLGILAALYVYFVGASVLNVVARKEALTEIATLTNAVSQLEREYFAASKGIGPDDGTRLGLSPVENTVYIHRPGTTAIAAPLSSDEI